MPKPRSAGRRDDEEMAVRPARGTTPPRGRPDGGGRRPRARRDSDLGERVQLEQAMREDEEENGERPREDKGQFFSSRFDEADYEDDDAVLPGQVAEGPLKGGCCCCGGKEATGDEEDKPQAKLKKRVKRRCRDCPCLCFFILYWMVMGAITGLSYIRGEPMRLVYPNDYNGKTCGSDDTLLDKKRVYYPRLAEDAAEIAKANLGGSGDPAELAATIANSKLYGICLPKCPAVGDIICTYEREEQLIALAKEATAAEVADTRKSLAMLRTDCWTVYLQTREVVFRCVPFPVTQSESTYFCRDEKGYNQITEAEQKNCKGTIETKTKSSTQSVSGATSIMTALASAHSTTMRYFGDVKNAWLAILLCGPVLGVVASFFYIMFMSVFTKCIVWVGLVMIEVILLASSFACFCKAGVIDLQGFVRKVNTATERYNLTSSIGDKMDEFQQLGEISENNPRYWETAAFVMLLVCLFYFMVIVVIRDRIALAVALIGEAGKTISKRMKMLLMYPFVTYIWVFALCLYFVVVSVYIWSATDFTVTDLKNTVNAIKGNFKGGGENGTALAGGTDSMDGVTLMLRDIAARAKNASAAAMAVINVNKGCLNALDNTLGGGSWSWQNVSQTDCTGNSTASMFSAQEDSLTPYLFAFVAFGFIWTNQYIQAVGYITIAGAIQLDYWNEPDCDDETLAAKKQEDPEKSHMPDLPAWPLFRALRRTIRYHLGSAAFGSFIIAVVIAIRYIMMYIHSKASQAQNKAVQTASKALIVCLKVFEKCVRYLTRNTYILIAIEGKPFWTSAYRSFKLLQNNSIRFAAAQGLASFLLFIAKLGVTAFCTLACFLMIEHMPQYQAGEDTEVLSPLLPCAVTAFSALVVVMSFMSIYEIGIDTLLISFCLDEDKFKKGEYEKMLEKGMRRSKKMFAERNDKKKFAKYLRDETETKLDVKRRLDYMKMKVSRKRSNRKSKGGGDDSDAEP